MQFYPWGVAAMIVEMRTYTLAFGAVVRYFELYRELGQAVQWQILGKPLGYYYTEVGALNQVVHIWRYHSFDERLSRRASLWVQPDWLQFIKAVEPLVVTQESRLMLETPLGRLPEEDFASIYTGGVHDR